VLGDWIGDGVVVTNDQAETDQLRVVEGSHPTPDADGQAGAEKVLDLAETATGDQFVICLVSGGGSALLSAPADGIDLADLQLVTDDLLESGASISTSRTRLVRTSACYWCV